MNTTEKSEFPTLWQRVQLSDGSWVLAPISLSYPPENNTDARKIGQTTKDSTH